MEFLPPKRTECAQISLGTSSQWALINQMENKPNSTPDFTSPKSAPPAGSAGKSSTGPQLTLSPPVITWSIIASAVIGWAYFSPLSGLSHTWFTQADYSHGFLVPVFAGYLLWVRRGMFKPAQIGTSRTQIATLLGAGLLLLAAGIRCFSAYQFYPLADAPSLIPCLVGIVLLVGGWEAFRWAWPSLLYLSFMLPLPGGLAGMLSNPLQRVATVSSTWLLQVVGVPAVARGNVIWLTSGKIGVVEACSGLRMLMLFLAITAGASFIIQRPLWEKIFVAASALVIAVITNILRITVTAFLYENVNAELAEKIFHDLAGWLMMPVATALLVLELYVLSKLLIVPDRGRPVMVSRPMLRR